MKRASRNGSFRPYGDQRFDNCLWTNWLPHIQFTVIIITIYVTKQVASFVHFTSTGSGKTHTMEGPDEDMGVVFRAITQVFCELDEVSHEVFTFYLSIRSK